MLPVIYGNVNVFFHNNFTSFLCIIYNFFRIFPFFILFFQSFGNILSLIAHPSPISVRTIRFVPIFPFLFFPKNLLKNVSHLFVSYIRFRSLHYCLPPARMTLKRLFISKLIFPEPLKPFPTAVPCNTGKNTSFILRMIKGNKKRKGEHSSSFLS